MENIQQYITKIQFLTLKSNQYDEILRDIKKDNSYNVFITLKYYFASQNKIDQGTNQQ